MVANQPTLLGRIAITLAIIVPVGLILLIGTWGVILIPPIVVGSAAPLFVLNYIIWGHAFSLMYRDEAMMNVGNSAPTQNAAPEPI